MLAEFVSLFYRLWDPVVSLVIAMGLTVFAVSLADEGLTLIILNIGGHGRFRIWRLIKPELVKPWGAIGILKCLVAVILIDFAWFHIPHLPRYTWVVGLLPIMLAVIWNVVVIMGEARDYQSAEAAFQSPTSSPTGDASWN